MKHIIRIAALVLCVCMLSVTAFAAFTPSVEQKPSPEVFAPEIEAGKGTPMVDGKPAIVVRIVNGDDEEITASCPVEQLVVIPMSDSKNQSAEIKAEMEAAFKQLAEAKSLADVAPTLPQVLKDNKIDVPVEKLVVRDLVHIILPKHMQDALAADKTATVAVGFKMKLDKGQNLIVMVQDENDEWLPLAGDSVIVDEKNGTVVVFFPMVGNVAFVVG